LWFCHNWTGNRKTRYAGMTIVECMARVYLLTEDQALLDFCYDYFDFMEENDLFDGSLSAMLSPELHYNSTHGSLYANEIDRPALVYACSGEEKYLQASLNAYRKGKEKCILPTGGITCESEYLAPVGPVVETEYCGITFYNKSLANLAMITGESCFADDMEQTVFNCAEGARKKDERAIAYLTSPNQVMASASSSYANEGHQVYAPCVPVACCPVNSVRVIPEFLRSVALQGKDGLYFSVYAPAAVQYGGMKITLDTDYPFRDRLTFRFEAEGEGVPAISCHFRIPSWCDAPAAVLNGHPVELIGNGYAAIDHTFIPGDLLELCFPMKPYVTVMHDDDRLHMHPLSIFRGPLLFSLPIPEIWQGYPGHPATPLPEGWQWYHVHPVIPPSGLDVYDDMGMRRNLITWNAALDENLSPEDIEVTDDGSDAYPWEHSPITMHLRGWRAPYSYAPYPQKTLEPYVENGYAYVSEEMPLVLTPYGCTALRISCFPRAKI
ncbi:MAG: glycoside hydrolase family 127 protein, partial [Clostridia bacterium]|nr:glycoside hydrolase family 127 protein [Clostridia bacterium]